MILRPRAFALAILVACLASLGISARAADTATPLWRDRSAWVPDLHGRSSWRASPSRLQRRQERYHRVASDRGNRGRTASPRERSGALQSQSVGDCWLPCYTRSTSAEGASGRILGWAIRWYLASRRAWRSQAETARGIDVGDQLEGKRRQGDSPTRTEGSAHRLSDQPGQSACEPLVARYPKGSANAWDTVGDLLGIKPPRT